MQQLDTDLWVSDAPLRFVGLELGTRMTVVRLPGGELLLHSPVPTTPELVRAVGELGPVTYLIAPNRFHHMFVGEWQAHFPEAAIHVAPGLETKRADLSIASVLGNAPEPAWGDVLDQVAIGGFPFSNEIVFFHRPSATLIATDLAFHIGPKSPALTRLAFRAAGVYERLAPTLLERALVRDRAAFRDSIARILAWPFDRVVIAHGEVFERGGHDALREGLAWALPEA